MSRYKIGDIVLVKSRAGDCIPKIHVRLTKRITVKPTKGKQVGIRRTMDWDGYSGWDAEIVYQQEADILRKEWSIPFYGPGDETFVFDDCIIKKPRKLPSFESNGKRRIVRKFKKN
jgi:hypothetical protein